MSQLCKAVPPMASLISTQSLVFVNPEAAKTFECAICYEILKKPVQIGCSDHVFCKGCIKKVVSPETQSIRCPICRVSCKTKSIRRVKFVERQINNLLVKCPNHVITTQKAQYLRNEKGLDLEDNEDEEEENDQDASDGSSQSESDEDVDLFLRNGDGHICGQKRKRTHDDDAENKTIKKRKLNDAFDELCDWIGPLSDVSSHRKRCALQLKTCIYCFGLMLRRELTHHVEHCECFPMKCIACGHIGIIRHRMERHIQQDCPMTIISCPQECGTQLKRKDTEDHIEYECTETVIKCAFHKFGCFQTFKRKDEIKHAQNASINHNHLVKVSDKVNELTNQNHELCLRIDELEGNQDQIEEKYNAFVALQHKRHKHYQAFEQKQHEKYNSLEGKRRKQFQYIFKRIDAVRENAVQKELKFYAHRYMDHLCIQGDPRP
eukprot:228855_1